jgi:hypothetical protein
VRLKLEDQPSYRRAMTATSGSQRRTGSYDLTVFLENKPESVVPLRGCTRPLPTLRVVFLMFHRNASQCLPSLTHRFVSSLLVRSKSTSNETDAKVLDLSAVGVESPSFLSHLTSSRCVYVCAPFLVFSISRLFPDIIVSACRLVDRRLTLLDSVEPTFFRQNPLFTIGAIGLSLALRLHK